MFIRKIACVGYHYTGAGVIDDLFRECDNVYQGTYEAEIRILHDPDGVSDLEYHLVENPHRLSSGLAIKRFIDYAKRNSRQIEKIVGEDWIEIATNYAESLSLIKYHGYVGGDLLFLSPRQRIHFFCRRVVNKLLPKQFLPPKDSNLLPSVITYYSRLDENEFINKTKVFVELLCEKANKDKKEFIMLDQFIGSNYPSRYLRYANDLKAIIVDRDPRDLYISRMLSNDRVLPHNPHEFCIYHRGIRQTKEDFPSDQCLKVNFEDMIYNYDDYVNKVLNFVGVSKEHHVSPLLYFDPNKSIKGTKLWQCHPEYSEEVKIIEKELPEYLYQYK